MLPIAAIPDDSLHRTPGGGRGPCCIGSACATRPSSPRTGRWRLSASSALVPPSLRPPRSDTESPTASAPLGPPRDLGGRARRPPRPPPRLLPRAPPSLLQTGHPHHLPLPP